MLSSNVKPKPNLFVDAATQVVRESEAGTQVTYADFSPPVISKIPRRKFRAQIVMEKFLEICKNK